MPKNNLKENLGLFQSNTAYKPPPCTGLPPFPTVNSSANGQKTTIVDSQLKTSQNNVIDLLDSSPILMPIDTRGASNAPQTNLESSDWDDDLEIPDLVQPFQIPTQTPPTQSTEHHIEILDSESVSTRLLRSPPCLDPFSSPSSPEIMPPPGISSIEMDLETIPEPQEPPRPTPRNQLHPPCPNISSGSPETSGIVDLTDFGQQHEQPQQSRFSILQAEKIGLLEKKVRMLTEKLRAANIDFNMQDMDERVRRVDAQIAALNEPIFEEVDKPEYLGIENDDDLIISSPHKPMTLLSSPALSPIHYSQPPLEPSHYFQDEPISHQSHQTEISASQAAVSQARYPWTEEMFQVLTTKFGLLRFRSQQKDIIDWTLGGKDAIVLMPTGGGKSLCFQLPALCKNGATHGTTVVISPLISLMQDQVYHLKNRDIPAQMINSSLSAPDREAAYHELVNGSLKLVYLSPEMLSSSGRMRNELKNLHDAGKLARIVIDEAHCVSSWGHDFREDYLKLTTLKDEYPRAPVLALTGTANGAVLSDIKRCVRSNHNLFKQSFNRPNLYYEVRPKTEATVVSEIVRIFHQCQGKTGIVFCHSQNSCEKTAQLLQKQRVSAGFYHAGLPKEQRQQLQEDWQENKIKVMCATIAFGMGVDKPDVRFVVHLTLPRSIEGFYQESGRAGRDGLESRCIMFYNRGDYTKLSRLIYSDRNTSQQHKDNNGQNLKRVMQYCENMTDCRRKQILQYFDENVSSKICRQKCDNCLRKRTSRTVEKDMTSEAKAVVHLFEGIGNDRVTSLMVVDILRGLKHKRITDKGYDTRPQHGVLKDLDRSTVERLVYRLQDRNILQEYTAYNQGRTSMPCTYVKLGPSYQNVLSGARVVLDFIEEAPGSISRPQSTQTANSNKRPRSNQASAPKRKRFESSTQKSRRAAANIRALPL